MKAKILLLAAAFTTIGLIGSAMAGAKLFTSRTISITFSDDLVNVLPLDNAGTIKMTFNGVAGKSHMIFFAAECAVKGTGNISWVDVNIEVKSPGGGWVVVSPTDGDNAFCTSHGTDSLDTYVSAATHGVYVPTADGVQKIRVTTQLNVFTADGAYRFDDISLIVAR